MKKRINVTSRDILKGHKKSANYCPVALALKRVISTSYIKVGYTQLFLGEEYQEIKLSDKVTYFINAFDVGKAVSPTSFTLDIPDEYLKFKK